MHVEVLRSIPETFVHPSAGRLGVQRDVLLSSGAGHRLVVFRPRPGTPTVFDALHLLGQLTE